MSERNNRSLVQRATAADGSLRCYAAVTTDVVEEARSRHGLYPTAAAAVGRLMTATAMMGAMLKDDQRIMAEIIGDGPLRRIVADADAQGNVRAYAANPYVHLPANAQGKLDVAGAIGRGSLHIVKDLRLKELYRGTVPLVSGEIAEDFAYYFVQSEQVPSAVALGVLVEPSHEVSAAGGLIIQAMPEASDDVITDLETRLQGLQNVSHMVSLGMTAREIIEAALHGLGIQLLDEVPLQFFCDCSEDRFKRALIALGADELAAMIREQGEAELTCNFCGRVYHFNKDTLLELAQTARFGSQKTD